MKAYSHKEVFDLTASKTFLHETKRCCKETRLYKVLSFGKMGLIDFMSRREKIYAS